MLGGKSLYRKKTLVILYLLGLALVFLGLVPELITILAICPTSTASTCTSLPGPAILVVVLGIISSLAGLVLVIIAWVRILMKQAQQQQWTWFVWTLIFSWITMALYLIQAPETLEPVQPANAPSYQPEPPQQHNLTMATPPTVQS